MWLQLALDGSLGSFAAEPPPLSPAEVRPLLLGAVLELRGHHWVGFGAGGVKQCVNLSAPLGWHMRGERAPEL